MRQPLQPAHLRRAAFVVVALVAVMCAVATPVSARALLVAGGGPDLPVAELSTDSVVARIAMPSAVSGVATSRFGGRGYAAAGNALIEIDIDARAEIRRSVLPGSPISQLQPRETAGCSRCKATAWR